MIAKEPQTAGAGRVIEVPLEMIHVGERRGLNGPKVMELSKSIQDFGLLHPVTVRNRPTVDHLYELVAGRHRMEAYLILGRETIPAFVLPEDFGDRRAEMVEIDENLQRSSLTALEEAQAIARRKELWEEIYPETKRGAKGGRKKANGRETRPAANETNPAANETNPAANETLFIGDWGTLNALLTGPAKTTAGWNLKAADLISEFGSCGKNCPKQVTDVLLGRCRELIQEANEMMGRTDRELDPTVGSNSGKNGRQKTFVEDTAEKIGQSRANVARKAKLGKDLPKEIAAKIKQTPIAKNEKELAKLAKLAKKDPEQAATVAEMIASGEVKSVTEAVTEPKPQTDQQERDEAFAWLREKMSELTEVWRDIYGPKIATITRWRGVVRAVDFGG